MGEGTRRGGGGEGERQGDGVQSWHVGGSGKAGEKNKNTIHPSRGVGWKKTAFWIRSGLEPTDLSSNQAPPKAEGEDQSIKAHTIILYNVVTTHVVNKNLKFLSVGMKLQVGKGKHYIKCFIYFWALDLNSMTY